MTKSSGDAVRVNVSTSRVVGRCFVRPLLQLAQLALAASMALGCQSAAAPAPAPGQVTGQLVDVIHDRPAAGVHVRAHDMGETVTDADGRFELTLPSGTHTLYLAGEAVLSGQVERVVVTAGKPLVLRELLSAQKGDEPGQPPRCRICARAGAASSTSARRP